MASFTGAEIAALIRQGSIIGSHEGFSRQLQEQIESSPFESEVLGIRHWYKASYLITNVIEDDGVTNIVVRDRGAVEQLCAYFMNGTDSGFDLTTRDGVQLHVLLGRGALKNVTDMSEIPETLRSANLPLTLFLSKNPPNETGSTKRNCGSDHVTAVNLTRALEKPVDDALVEQTLRSVYRRNPSARQVHITHFNGGPCDSKKIRLCIVLGGRRGAGWTTTPSLLEAVSRAYRQSARAPEGSGDLRGGQTVRLKGLVSRKDLNAQRGVALRFVKRAQRWLVRLFDVPRCSAVTC